MGDSVGAQSTREKRRMRKRFALLSTLVVLAAALALPASTLAASGYTSKTVYNYCNGYQVNLKMKAIAAGWTNANKLSIDSWAQRKNGGWQTVYQWNRVNYSFAITGAKHTLTAWRSYNGNSQYYFRLLFTLKAWHNNQLLASSSFYSVKC